MMIKTITGKSQIDNCLALVTEMTEYRTELSARWLARNGWKVAPAESAGRFFFEDIPRIVSALNAAGHYKCFAVTTEDLGDTPPCYIVPIAEEGFRELNEKLGAFQFLLTDEARSWAISCTVFYNLFAGPDNLVEAMLGKPVAEAQNAFLQMATEIAKARGDPDEFLLKVARRYTT